MTCNYSYFLELNENITRRVRFGEGSYVSINGKGSILFQGKNGEQKLLKDIYYIPTLRSNVISLGQAKISGYDISIRVTVASLDLINEFKKKMSDLGELTYYLGIKVSHEKDCLEIKQERYALKIVKEADLMYSVGVISRYMQSPRNSHARAIKQILRYYKGTTSFGIKHKQGNDMRLVGYNSHNVDIDDGRSTTSHVSYLGTSPITQCSQKQTHVALSSCEAEFMAATTCQAIFNLFTKYADKNLA
ncbi:uncharacterized mitochondrial protein-like protein [Tanacetum coccineum]